MKIKKYLAYLKRNNYSKNTISTYKSVLTTYENELEDIRMVKKKLKTYFKNPNTCWTHYNIISSYYTHYNDKRNLSLKEIRLPQIPKKYFKVFTKSFLYKKTEIKQDDDKQTIQKKLLVRFLFETGIRAEELKNILNINKETLIVKGKGNKQREVFHNNETTSQLNNFSETTKTLRIWVKQILGKSFTPHSIRRSHATHLLTSGANPKMVMQQLGHEKLETTFRYLQLSMKENKKIYTKYF